MTGERSDSTAFEPSDGVEPEDARFESDGDPVDGWPVPLDGVTETIVATRGPNDRWNHAALGIEPATDPDTEESTAVARTFGRTRTRRNLAAGREAYVQFTADPIDFVAAALDVHETDAPILERSAAWARIDAKEADRSEDAGTEVVAWHLEPVDAAIRERAVPKLERGTAAVVEATVAASRLDVDAYDEADLLARLAWLGDVVERTGSERDQFAFERIDELTNWRERRD